MTAAEVAAFVAASESYEGWLDAGIIGADRNEIMAKLVIAAADAAADQSVGGRQTAGVAALTDVITQAGDIDDVPDGMIPGVTAAGLAAVAALRAPPSVAQKS